MKKVIVLLLVAFPTSQVKAWWDPGHLIVAMIAYKQLSESAKVEVDRLAALTQRDYPYINHFITMAAWPDDLKAEGVRSYDMWHYTNVPYNPDGVALPPKQEVDIIWAIKQMDKVLRTARSRDIDKARHLGFLAHFVGDIHQPLHTASFFSDKNPSGDLGGNEFNLKGKHRNLHAYWDDLGGLFSELNDISPYGVPKEALTNEEIEQYRIIANSLLAEGSIDQKCASQDDPDFWALESQKLAIKYGYKGVAGKNDRGWVTFIELGDEPSELYKENAQRIIKQQLVTAGLRLGEMLNDIFTQKN